MSYVAQEKSESKSALNTSQQTARTFLFSDIRTIAATQLQIPLINNYRLTQLEMLRRH